MVDIIKIEGIRVWGQYRGYPVYFGALSVKDFYWLTMRFT